MTTQRKENGIKPEKKNFFLIETCGREKEACKRLRKGVQYGKKTMLEKMKENRTMITDEKRQHI